MFEIKDELFKTLTEKQQSYFRIMKSKSGVLFLKGAPGVAKSAILKAIANKMEMDYVDIRLSMMDETDVGLYPYRSDLETEVLQPDGSMMMETVSVMSHAIPEWAFRANQRPTIIHFEELNRAPLAVRNAALQILLDRAIGPKFHFNDNVFMCSSGNLGDKDGTDVEEFDRALNNRLIHIPHTLDIKEWISDFANEHVHPTIVGFLTVSTEHFLHSVDKKNSKDDSDAYATPRTWTLLSNYIVENYGKNSPIQTWINDMRNIASAYVGVGAAQRFLHYLDESMRLTINEVLENFDLVKPKLMNCTRDKKSELLNSLRERKITEMDANQKKNLKKFLLNLSDDETVSYILFVVDNHFTYLPNPNIVNENNNLINEFFKDKCFDRYGDAVKAHIKKAKEQEELDKLKK